MSEIILAKIDGNSRNLFPSRDNVSSGMVSKPSGNLESPHPDKYKRVRHSYFPFRKLDTSILTPFKLEAADQSNSTPGFDFCALNDNFLCLEIIFRNFFVIWIYI